MIKNMTKYSFILLNMEKDGFLRELSELGVVDIIRSSHPIDEQSSAIMSEIEQLQQKIKCIQAGNDSKLAALKDKLSELQKEYNSIAVWGDFDREKLERLGIKLYQSSRKSFDKSWQEEYALEIIEESKDNIFFVIAGGSEGFPLSALTYPEKTTSEIQAEIQTATAELEAYAKSLEEQKKDIPALQSELQQLHSELNLYLAQCAGQTAAEESLVIYTGFAPDEEKLRLSEAFDKMGIYWSAEEATLEDNPPIELKNNKFVKQFETFTEMYGMPCYNEFDPTAFLSIFFLLFFAMCVGDVGYGLLLILIGFFLRGKEGGLAKMWSLIVTLGVGTVLVGALFGGFFGINMTAVEWIPVSIRNFWSFLGGNLPGTSYSMQMVISLGIGIFHICLAMITKAIWAVRKNGVLGSLSDLGWTLLIVGGIIGLAIGLMGVISELAMKWLLLGIAGVSALGIYFFSNLKRNPLINFGAGLWDTYNMASGLMGDVLSYIRLYALGLSGAMLGQTFNQIAMMVRGDDPSWQWIPFVLIVIIGHVLNLAMSCLGAFVHPLRLNFVEFFKNSGYDGAGRKYNPIRKQ